MASTQTSFHDATGQERQQVTMTDKNLHRTQFSKDVTAKQIVAFIRKSQEEWAKKFPERAHRLYPTVFDEQGNRIPKEKHPE